MKSPGNGRDFCVSRNVFDWVLRVAQDDEMRAG